MKTSKKYGAPRREINISVPLPTVYVREIEEAVKYQDEWLAETPTGVTKEAAVRAGLLRAAKNAAVVALEDFAVDIDALGILGMAGISEVLDEIENGKEVKELLEFQ